MGLIHASNCQSFVSKIFSMLIFLIVTINENETKGTRAPVKETTKSDKLNILQFE